MSLMMTLTNMKNRKILNLFGSGAFASGAFASGVLQEFEFDFEGLSAH